MRKILILLSFILLNSKALAATSFVQSYTSTPGNSVYISSNNSRTELKILLGQTVNLRANLQGKPLIIKSQTNSKVTKISNKNANLSNQFAIKGQALGTNNLSLCEEGTDVCRKYTVTVVNKMDKPKNILDLEKFIQNKMANDRRNMEATIKLFNI